MSKDNKVNDIGEDSKTFQLLYDFPKKYKIHHIISAFFNKECIEPSDFSYYHVSSTRYPVIIDAKQINYNQVEITRIFIDEKFYNEQPYATETVTINRDNKKPHELVLNAYCDHGYKKDQTVIYGAGLLRSRMTFDFTAHKSFMVAKKIQMFSDIFIYKKLKDMNNMCMVMDIGKVHDNRKKSLKSFEDLKLDDLLDIV